MPQENTLIPEADPREAADRLAALKQTEQIRNVMNALEPTAAARMVAHAPGIEAQTRLIWSLTKTNRAAVLDELPATAVASLIQNRERRNRRLLGDVSLEQFAEILRFCHPRQRYYWITLANSFADVGANLLVLLLSAKEVAGALLTVPEFRAKLAALHRDIRLLRPGGFEKDPPVRDRKLKAILIRLFSYDPDRYREVIEAAMRMPPEVVSGPDVPGGFLPKLPAPELPRVPELPPLRPRSMPEPPEDERPSVLPVPVALPGGSLVQRAVAALAPARREALEREMGKLLSEEVRAEGGSLARRDLERVATRVEAYVRLGLQGVPEEPAAVADVLREVPFGDIVERGSIALEQLRQVAYKLKPFSAVLDAGQRALIADLADLRATMHPETGTPALFIRPAGRGRFRPVPVAEVQERLAGVSLWVGVSRALGIRVLSEKLAARTHGSLALLAALGVSLLQCGKWDPQVLGPDGLREVRDGHFDPERRAWLPGTAERLDEALDAWAEHARMEPAMRPRFRSRVLEAMAQLERYLGHVSAPTWERFTPR